MEHRKERNEFGLDEYNALDVQNEGAKDAFPWLVVAVGLLAITAVAISTRVAARTPRSAPSTHPEGKGGELLSAKGNV